jgi:hypothetical protein
VTTFVATNCYVVYILYSLRSLLVIALGVLPIYSFGQIQPDPPAIYWVSAGAGWTQFPSVMGAVGYEFKGTNKLLIARVTRSGEILGPADPSLKANELGLLYGLRFGKFRFSAGVSSVWGNNRGRYLYTDPDPLMGSGRTYEFVDYRTIGIPAEIRFITATKGIGIGITGFGNLNQARSYAGINVSIYAGKLK